MAEFSGWRQQASNKNLLINPRFRVNQRGQTEYTKNEYCVDGWRLSGTGRIDIIGSEIKMTRDNIESSYLNLYQELELHSELAGKIVTASALVRGKASIVPQVNNAYPAAAYHTADSYDIISCTFTVPSQVSSIGINLQPTENDSPIYLKAAKLEQGPISTLALDLMQPYTLQDYQRELMECQRYLQIYDGPLMATANTAWYASFLFDLDVEMRVIPTFSYEGDIVISDNAGETEAVFNSLKSYAGDTKRPLMRFGTPNGKLVGGHIYVVNPLKLIFSAEL